MNKVNGFTVGLHKQLIFHQPHSRKKNCHEKKDNSVQIIQIPLQYSTQYNTNSRNSPSRLESETEIPLGLTLPVKEIKPRQCSLVMVSTTVNNSIHDKYLYSVFDWYTSNYFKRNSLVCSVLEFSSQSNHWMGNGIKP